MDGQQLLRQLQTYISNGVLTLSTDNSLKSSGINSLLGNFFANTLSVTLGGNSEVDATHVSFTNCSFNAQEFGLYRSQATLPTQITFEIVAPDDRIELQIQFTLPDSYTFSDSFQTVKDLVQNPLNDLKITKTKLLFNSKNSPNTFEFMADVVKTEGLIKPLGWLFENDVVLSGTIQLIRTSDEKVYPEMLLKTAISKSPPVMNFEMDVLLQAQSKMVTITSSEDSSSQQVQLITNITIVADFITSKFRLPIVIDVRSGSNSNYHVMLDLLRPSPSISQLSDISDLTGQKNPSESLSADTPIGNLSFQSVEFRLDATNRSITDFTIGIHLGTNWTIKQKVLELEGLTMVIIIPNFARPTDFGLMVMADLLIGNARANAYISYPDKIIGVQTTTLININDFLSTFAENTKLPGTGDLTIYEFNLMANVANQAYSLSCSAAGNWSVIPNFVLEEIEFALDYDGTLILVFGCVFTIAKAELYLQVAKGPDTWTLSGGTYKKQQISLTDFVTDLLSIFHIALPNDLPQFYLLDLKLTNYETKTGNFTFQANAAYINDDDSILKKIEGQCVINRAQDTNQQPIWSGNITGIIKIGENQFNVSYDFKKSKTITASWQAEDGKSLGIVDLCRALLDTDPPDIPADWDLGLNRASFIYNLTNKELVLEANSVNYGEAIFIALKNQQQEWKLLFRFSISKPINLSNLPLVGQEFPKDQTIGVDDLQFLIANKDFTPQEITTFNNLIEQGAKIPIKDSTAIALPKGLNVAAKMQFGSQTNILALPISSSTPQTPTPSQPTVIPSTTTPPSDNATWFKIQKSFGPVHFERVGVQYKDAAIGFLLDASLNLAGLSLSLDGLAVNSPLNQFDPKFDLKGIGIDYKGGDTLEIGGAFLRTTRNGIDEYNGAAVIKFNVKGKALKLSAIGSYAYFQGHPSLFIYALLDYPIGGPSFFFVTGLAAGFGYNRALKVPTIDQVATFPLVAEAVNPPPAEGSNSDQAARLTGELTKLRDYIPPETGQIFLAIGIKFTSFKLIDSFLLLTVAFGNRFELNLLGLATLIAPPNPGPGVSPVAQVQLALKASFLPAEGFIGIIAQLTPNSYILSQACHLTGGFAFYGWFAPNVHEGDFVLTLGGYHPLFKVPDHYPKVPRLSLNWQVSSELYIKADAYFALTPSAIMAGGHLQATWNSGPLSAWFNAGADFLMSWKPYHYDISIYIDMGVSYTFHFFGTHHITIQLGADLHIWGPEFAGIAHIHLWIISFDVSFGSSGSQAPIPMGWNDFKTSFLPAADAICTIAVKEGLVRKVNQDDKTDLGIINPKDLCLVTNSVIPIKTCHVNLNTQGINTEFGIGPMAVTPGQLTSTLTISVTRDGKSLSSAEFDEDFACSPLFKKVPVALWGESLTPSLNGNQFIENTLSGLEIKPKKQPEPGATQAINRRELQFSTTPINNAYHWRTISTFQEETTKDIRNTIVDNAVNNTRDNLLKALNLKSEEIDLSATIADHLLGSPKIGVLVN